MTASFHSKSELWLRARSNLSAGAEQVGFFLADFDAGTKTFTFTDWRAVPSSGFDFQSAYHVTLTDEAQGDVIRWAWQTGACLIEAHSHDGRWQAAFSPSDVAGFAEWVPHVMWRLRGRPYAALVGAGDTFDALAWIDGPDTPDDVVDFRLDDGSRVELTQETWHKLSRAEDGRDE